MQKTPKRTFEGINYVKCFACIAVLLVHFRLNVQNAIPANFFDFKSALFMALDYQLFIVCVPLFFICTGFLMLNKKFSYDYYIKLCKILLLYVICSLISYFILLIFKHQSLSVTQIIDGIKNYKLIEYAWYVKTYVIMYLLFPFINLIIKQFNENNKWLFEVLIISLITLIGVPTFLMNVGQLPFNFNLHIIYQIYPYVYYLIGAYFRKFHRIYNLKILLSLEILVFVLAVFWNLLKANPYAGGAEGSYPSVVIFIQSILLFLLINQFFTKNNKFVTTISKYTLPIYLLSFCVDQLVYSFLLQLAPTAKILLPFILLIVAFNFSISFGLSFIAEKITDIIWKPLYFILKLPEKIFIKISTLKKVKSI